MMKRRTRILAGTVVAVVMAIGLGIFFFVAPKKLDAAMNEVVQPPPYVVPADVAAFHESLTVVDLHADTLLWSRDLAKPQERGHVDLVRLSEGNVALQVFSAVTQSPRGMNIEKNDDSTDNIFWLVLAQRWPPRTWFSYLERALYQADRLRSATVRSDNHLAIIRTRRDLAIFMERRRLEPAIVAGLLAIEGAHALEGDPGNVDVLFDAGYRMMSMAHFFDSDLGGSAHGVDKGGLTEKGRDVLSRMEAKGMIVDLSHASAAQIDDVLALATKPVVVSHGGVRGTCDNNRNLTDDQLKKIAANGGLMGIGFWDTATCGNDAQAIARAIRYTADLIGVDHVALGSDFDGTVTVPFDASGMALLTQALLADGFSREDIGKIMGGNVIRLLQAGLPG